MVTVRIYMVLWLTVLILYLIAMLPLLIHALFRILICLSSYSLFLYIYLVSFRNYGPHLGNPKILGAA